jgi:hypothetical protein
MPIQVLTEKEAIEAAKDGVELLIVPNIPGGGYTASRSMVIASVHYVDREASYWRGGKRTYRVEAVETKPTKPEEATTCIVYDSQQWVPSHFRQDTDGAEPDGDSEPAILPMEGITADLLRKFKGGMTGRMGANPPGIMAIAGTIPTPAEFSKMIADETRHCVAAVEDADELFFKQEFKKIGKGHRKALRWLGSEKRKWAEEIEPGFYKKAPTTGNRIPMEALVDDRGTDLIEWYDKHGFDPAEFGDTYISTLLSKRKGTKVASGAPKPLSGDK